MNRTPLAAFLIRHTSPDTAHDEWTRGKQAQLAHALSIHARAGLRTDLALDGIAPELESGVSPGSLDRTASRIREGVPVAQAFKLEGGRFDPMWIPILEGPTHVELHTRLRELGKHFHRVGEIEDNYESFLRLGLGALVGSILLVGALMTGIAAFNAPMIELENIRPAPPIAFMYEMGTFIGKGGWFLIFLLTGWAAGILGDARKRSLHSIRKWIGFIPLLNYFEKSLTQAIRSDRLRTLVAAGFSWNDGLLLADSFSSPDERGRDGAPTRFGGLLDPDPGRLYVTAIDEAAPGTLSNLGRESVMARSMDVRLAQIRDNLEILRTFGKIGVLIGAACFIGLIVVSMAFPTTCNCMVNYVG